MRIEVFYTSSHLAGNVLCLWEQNTEKDDRHTPPRVACQRHKKKERKKRKARSLSPL